MAKILNIESSTDICSIAIAEDGKELFLVEQRGPQVHTKYMTIMIKSCMEGANLSFGQLDAIAVSAGPGSYTSLRIGVTTAKAIAYAHNIPMIAVCTLEGLSYGLPRLKEGEKVIAMIDARREEVYAGVYNDQHEQLLAPEPHILSKNSFLEWLDNSHVVYLVGNGAPKAKKWLDSAHFILKEIQCSASYMVRPSFEAFQEGIFEDIAYYTPNYIKGANITKSKKSLF